MESITPPDALKHIELDIAPALKPFVARRMRTWSEGPIDFTMPLPPTGSVFMTLVTGAPMSLEFTPGEPEPVSGLFIGGQLRHTMPISRIHGQMGITGVEFTPTGFYRLFHCDCQAFTDAAPPLEKALPEQGARLRQDLAATRDIREKMALLHAFLLERVPEALPASIVDDAVARVEAAHGVITVVELARRCHLSERQLNRRFLREVGVGPKHFAKVTQLKQALTTMQSGNPGELQQLAQRSGYFDQAHFINDFQRLIGTNPLAFLEAGSSFLRTYMKKRA